MKKLLKKIKGIYKLRRKIIHFIKISSQKMVKKYCFFLLNAGQNKHFKKIVF